MSYCSSCGKEIMDQAVICPHCGCATARFASQAPGNTEEYPAIRAYADSAKTVKVLGIVSAVLMFGIGVIFAIIATVKISQIGEPTFATQNPQELALIEKAKGDIKLGRILSALAFIGLGLAVAVIAFGGML